MTSAFNPCGTEFKEQGGGFGASRRTCSANFLCPHCFEIHRLEGIIEELRSVKVVTVHSANNPPVQIDVGDDVTDAVIVEGTESHED